MPEWEVLDQIHPAAILQNHYMHSYSFISLTADLLFYEEICVTADYVRGEMPLNVHHVVDIKYSPSSINSVHTKTFSLLFSS